jgi:hypothetical protein
MRYARFGVKSLSWFNLIIAVVTAGRNQAVVHKVVEKRKKQFSYSLNIGCATSCAACISSGSMQGLHQQSALTIMSQVFTFASVDG